MLRARHHFEDFTFAFNPHNSSMRYKDSCYSHFVDEETEAPVKQFSESRSYLNGKRQNLSPVPDNSLCLHLLQMWPAELCFHKLFLGKHICVQIIEENAVNHMPLTVRS